MTAIMEERRTAHLQEDILLERLRNGDRGAEEGLVKLMDPAIRSAALSYSIPGVSLEEKKAAAAIGVINGIRSYVPGKSSLRNWCSYHIRTEMNLLKSGERKASQSEADTDTVESVGSIHLDRFETEEVVKILRDCWPFLTDSEKRAMIAVLSGSKFADVGRSIGMTKQAVQKGVDGAREMIELVRSGNWSEIHRRRGHLAGKMDRFAHCLEEEIGNLLGG